MGVGGGKAMVLATDSVSNSWLHAQKKKEILKAILLNEMFVLSSSNSTINKDGSDSFLEGKGRRNIIC